MRLSHLLCNLLGVLMLPGVLHAGERIAFSIHDAPKRERIAFSITEPPAVADKPRIAFSITEPAEDRKPALLPAIPAGVPDEAAKPEPFELFVAYRTACPPCAKLKKDHAAGLLEPFELVEAARPGWAGNLSYPLIWWKVGEQTLYVSGYEGPDNLRSRVNASLRPKSTSAVVRQKWTYPGNIRTHLTDPKQPHALPRHMIDKLTDQECIELHDALHDSQSRVTRSANPPLPAA